VSTSADEIASAVGRRTVYSLDEIEALTRKGEVLVVMFRQDRILRGNPIALDELVAAEAIGSWPQSITRIRKESIEWLAIRADV